MASSAVKCTALKQPRGVFGFFMSCVPRRLTCVPETQKHLPWFIRCIVIGYYLSIIHKQFKPPYKIYYLEIIIDKSVMSSNQNTALKLPNK